MTAAIRPPAPVAASPYSSKSSPANISRIITATPKNTFSSYTLPSEPDFFPKCKINVLSSVGQTGGIAINLLGFRSNLRRAGSPSRRTPCLPYGGIPIPPPPAPIVGRCSHPAIPPVPIMLHIDTVSFRRPLTNLSVIFWKLVSTRM